MSSRGLWVRVDGMPAEAVGAVGDLVYSTTATGGSQEASWSMDVSPMFNHPSFRPGAVVQILDGPTPVWAGVLSAPEVSAEGTTMTAVGHGPNAFDWLCFTSLGDTTSTPNTAIDRAIADGLPCTRPTSISSSPFAAADPTDAINKLGDLLDDQSLSVSKRWGVNPYAEFYQAADPTTPSWELITDDAQVSRVDEEYASHVFVRYMESSTTYDTAYASDPLATPGTRREYPLDATNLGIISSAKAQGIADAVIARGKARYQLTEPFVVNSDRLSNMGGVPAHLPSVRAQQMVLTYNVRTQQGPTLPTYEFIIGRTQYKAVEDELLIAPVELASRTFGDVIAKILAKASVGAN